MRSFMRTGLVVVSTAFLLSTLMGSMALAQTGKELFAAKGCTTCHGADGDSPIMPTYPRLAGQQADYLVAQLKAFKSQQRKSAQSALMWGMAAQLNDQQMKAIAAYLSKAK